MTVSPRPLLLDTCAAIWIAEGDPITNEAKAALGAARLGEVPIRVSPMTAWEVGMLASRSRIRLSMDPLAWFDALIALPGLDLAELTPAILVASSQLPGSPPSDPVDRIVAATARARGYAVVTRDQRLLDYAAIGHIQAVRC